jgi:hypothetical protein
MGSIRKYPDRIVVSLEIGRLLNAPVYLRQGENIVRTEHTVSEVLSNLLWLKLCHAYPGDAVKRLFGKVNVIFNFKTSSVEAEFNMLPMSEP